MHHVQAPEIHRHWYSKKIYLLIPGGWLMNVPEYSVEPDFEEAYTGWFLRSGLSFAKAQEKMRNAVQAHAEAGFRTSLLHSVTYWAKVYSELYPERMRPAAGRKKTFLLVGYDPAKMQTIHVPGYRLCYKEQPLAKGLLLAMKPAL